MAMFRSILGVITGIIVGGITVGLLELAGHLIFPPPAGMDPSNFESIKERLPNLPLGAFLCVLGAWTIGIFFGSLLSALIAGRAALIHAGIVGAVFFAFCVANLIMIPHPLWFMAASIVLVPLATIVGALLANSRKRPQPESV